MENLTVSTQLVSQVANASSIDASAAVSSPDASTDPTLGGLFGTLLAQQIALVLAQDGQQGELPIDITKKGTANDTLPEVVAPQDIGLVFGMMPHPAFASLSASALASELPAPVLVSELPAPVLVSELPAPVLVSELPAPVLVSELPAPVLVSELPMPALASGFSGPVLLPLQKALAANLKSAENLRSASQRDRKSTR